MLVRDKNIADNNQVGGARGVGVKGVCVSMGVLRRASSYKTITRQPAL